jgi:asparaginyl-tRNA synthetase
VDTWGTDLQSEHERYLVEKHFKKPVILYNYPAAIKSFYMRQNEDGKTVRQWMFCSQVSVKLSAGHSAKNDMIGLVNRVKELNLPKKTFGGISSYANSALRPHSGFGLALND